MLGEHVRVNGGIDCGLHFGGIGPNVFQIDILTFGILTEWLGVEVEVHRAGKSIGNHQRRTRQVVHFHVGVDAALKVSVPREHRGHREIVVIDGLRDFFIQGTRVSDTGSAAVTDEVEPQGFKVVHESGLFVVVRDHFGARCESCFHPGLGLEALLCRVSGQEAGSQHHRRVRGVGARGDRSNRHSSVANVEGVPSTSDRDLRARGLGRQEVLQVFVKLILGVIELDAILGATGAGNARYHRGEVELHIFGVARLHTGVVPQPLGFAVCLDESDLLRCATGKGQVVQSDLVNRENRSSGAKLRAHVSDGGPVRQGNLGHTGSIEFDKFSDHPVLAKHLGDRQHHVGGRNTGRNGAGELEAHNPGNQHGHGLAQHGCLCLDASHSPTEHTEPIDHGGVRVGSDTGVGEGLGNSVDVFGVSDFREVLDVHLVNDSRSRGNHLEVVERCLAPTEELIALAIALVFNINVALKRIGLTKQIRNHRVVDNELCRRQGVDLRGVSSEIDDGFAHGSQVHNARHAGEILKNNSGRGELDFSRRLGLLVPPTERFNLLASDVGTVLGAQEVFEENFEGKRKGLVALYRVGAKDLVTAVPHVKGVFSLKTVE